MHVKLNTSGDPSWNVKDLINNSTVIPFKHQELEKLVKIRLNPQGPFYIMLSKTKEIINGSIIMQFTKSILKYEEFGESNTMDTFPNTILYEDINDFTLHVEETEIQFKNSDTYVSNTFEGNFTNFKFIGFSSYNPAKWTIQEGNKLPNNAIFKFIFLFNSNAFWSH